ncbi:hypothetical protein RHT_00136 [Candidatus Rhabdochlamydia sp. T3358]|nr:hypothetical protein RHT_00136 [Candidatus Rhabdochlamydia sp. T3358]
MYKAILSFFILINLTFSSAYTKKSTCAYPKFVQNNKELNY